MTIEEVRQKITPLFKEYGVEYAGVFGSVARGEDTPGSDVDILVKLARPVSLLTFFRFNDELEAMLGRPVDLVTPNSLNRHVKPLAMAELKTLYEVR